MKPKVLPPVLTVAELETYLRAEFPQVFNADSGVSIEDAWHGGCAGPPGVAGGLHPPRRHHFRPRP